MTNLVEEIIGCKEYLIGLQPRSNDYLDDSLAMCFWIILRNVQAYFQVGLPITDRAIDKRESQSQRCCRWCFLVKHVVFLIHERCRVDGNRLIFRNKWLSQERKEEKHLSRYQCLKPYTKVISPFISSFRPSAMTKRMNSDLMPKSRGTEKRAEKLMIKQASKQTEFSSFIRNNSWLIILDLIANRNFLNFPFLK